MKEYEWKIYSFFGEVKAKNLESALVKIIRNYMRSVPNPGVKGTRIDIVVREKE